jgi:malic enzyme
MQTLPKCPVRGFEDVAIWYTPGVAAPCREIQADPELAFAHPIVRYHEAARAVKRRPLAQGGWQ